MDGVKDKPPEVLDDLRQKRLAYFGDNRTSTSTQRASTEPMISSTKTINTINCPQEYSNMHTEQADLEKMKADLHKADKSYKTDRKHEIPKSLTNGYENHIPAAGLNEITNQKMKLSTNRAFVSTSTSLPNNRTRRSDLTTSIVPSTSSLSSEVKSVTSGNIGETWHEQHTLHTDGNTGANKGQIKTTAFYFSNPEATGDFGNIVSDKLETDGKNVDNIPNDIAFISVQKQPVKDPVLVDGYDETVERLIKATKDELLGNQVKDDIWSSFRRGSDAGSDRSAIAQTKATGKGHVYDHSVETSPGVNDSYLDHKTVYTFSKSPVSSSEYSNDSINKPKTTKPNTSSSIYRETPTYSKIEPIATVSHQHVATPGQLSGTVDEIFQSQQAHFNPQQQRQLSVNESQDISPLPVCYESLDLSELGLSTHRPESEREVDDLVDAKDINLGDTVTEELRSALGENKFQEFLVKSKRDLDDLHERFSDRSTGRQEKNQSKDKLGKSMESQRSPNDRNICVNKSEFSSETVNSGEKPRKSSFEGRVSGQLLRRPQEELPGAEDKDAASVITGQNTGVAKTDFYKQLKSNPAYKPKKQPSVNTSLEYSQTKSAQDMTVLEVSKESPRTSLHRPKHEPHNIYQERTGVRRNSTNSKSETFSSNSLTSAKNYEQVTVPRNVAFSANEIYHQAYGNESVSSSIDVSAASSIISGVPTSPRTPSGYVHPAVSMMQYSTQSSYTAMVTTSSSPAIHHAPHPPTSHVQSPYTVQYTRSPSSDPSTNVNPMAATMSRQSSVTMETTAVPHPPGHPLPPTDAIWGTNREHQMSAYDPKGFTINRYSPPMMQGQPPRMPHPPVEMRPCLQPSPPPGYLGNPTGYLHQHPGIGVAPHPPLLEAVVPGFSTDHPQQNVGIPTRYSHQDPGIGVAPHPPLSEPVVQGISTDYPHQNVGIPTVYSHQDPDIGVAPHPQLSEPVVPGISTDYPHQNMGIVTGYSYQDPGIGVAPHPQLSEPVVPGISTDYPHQNMGIPTGYSYQDPGIGIAAQPPLSEPVEVSWSIPSHTVSSQTDRSDKGNDEVTIVEESTFTSVSQIATPKDVVLPHPPPVQKGSKKKTPRKAPKHEAGGGSPPDTKRHIDGVRQHHEQRRQQQDVDRTTDEQNVEKQRKFAKASLDRYFSSLEQLYISTKRSSISESTPVSDNDESDNDVFTQNDETDIKRSLNKDSNIPLTQAHVSADELNENYGIDQVYQIAVRESEHVSEGTTCNTNNTETENFTTGRFVNGVTELIDDTPALTEFKSMDVIHNKVIANDNTDLAGKHSFTSETMHMLHTDKIVTDTTGRVDIKNKENYPNNEHNVSDDGCETLVTTFTIKAGGITERLDELGIDAEHLKHTVPDENQNNVKDNTKDTIEKGLKKKQGKLLLVCPECRGFNKEYMSWCSHCGEMLIGVEPVLVSKNREGKLRMKPVDNTPNTVSNVESMKIDSDNDNDLQTGKGDRIQEQTFSLDFGSINCKSPPKERNSDNINNLSPLKSDGVDSGRPSSDDHDQELQVYRIEQEVVDDICETITDPVVKGYVKSHFAKSHHSASLSKQSLPPSANNVPACKSNGNHSLEHEKEHVATLIKKFDDKHDKVEKSKVEDFSLESFTETDEQLKHLTTDLEESTISESRQLEHELKQHLNQSQQVISELQARKQVFDAQAKEMLHENKKEINDINIPASPSPEILSDEPLLIPPPIPNFADSIHAPVHPQFSTSEPVNRSELALKLPANSLDYSQFSSMDVSNEEPVMKNDVHEGTTENSKAVVADTDKAKAKAKEERRARRRRRGHGAIDVEIFGYEESHECRNSSRGQKMVPVLNLPLGSSDEEDLSLLSTDSEELSPVVMNTLANAWIPPDTKEQENIPMLLSASLAGTVSRSADHAPQGEGHNKQQSTGDDWQRLFQPQLEVAEADVAEADQEPEDDLNLDPSRPFLEHLVSGVKAKKPKSSKSKPVKSKVRQSIETPAYQRKWARSSTAWSSYNRGELSTASSFTASTEGQGHSRNLFRGRDQATEFGNQSARSPSPEKLTSGRGKKSRPASADLYRRKQQKQRASSGHPRSHKPPHPSDEEDDPIMGVVEHRLPRLGILELLQDHMASPNSTYDKYLQMTPRIESGQVSRWQCLPDEILLHIFAYIDQSDLMRCALVCQQFYRIAMDESLWKYITIKKRTDLDDACLMEISRRHPVSLALLQCQGDKVSAKGLRDLFKECAEMLKELNVSRCSRGALTGDSLLLHAAARCHNLTHVDTSWCHLTDSGLISISNSCRRLESLCINGCQAVSNEGLETVIRQHGVNLQVLELCGCFNITPRGLRCVANNCINLLTLSLGQCYKLTDSCIAQLSASLGRVETLDLRGCKQLKDNCIRRVVKNCTRLKHLSLANCPNITDVSVLEISTYLTDVRSVDVCGCKNITDSSIRAMVNTCTNLRNIDISSTSCTHRSVSMIANFSSQRLETLKLNFLSDITEQALIKLAKHCRRLKTIHLYGCTSVRNLDKVRDERPTFTIEM